MLAVVAAVVVRVTQSLGDSLLQDRGSSQILQEHGAWGVRAGLAGIVLAVLSLLHFAATSAWGRSRLAGRWPAWVGTALGVLAAAAGVVVGLDVLDRRFDDGDARGRQIEGVAAVLLLQSVIVGNGAGVGVDVRVCMGQYAERRRRRRRW